MSPADSVEGRRKELLTMGYRPGAVQIALDWAVNSAEAMAVYYENRVAPAQLLPRYLSDTEKYLNGLGLNPREAAP